MGTSHQKQTLKRTSERRPENRTYLTQIKQQVTNTCVCWAVPFAIRSNYIAALFSAILQGDVPHI